MVIKLFCGTLSPAGKSSQQSSKADNDMQQSHKFSVSSLSGTRSGASVGVIGDVISELTDDRSAVGWGNSSWPDLTRDVQICKRGGMSPM